MLRLLIVDDEYLSRYALKLLIQKHCPFCEIIAEGENGAQAVTLYEECLPDLVIMDIKMPMMDGIEASSLILKKHSQALIILLTAYSDFEYTQRSIELGIKGYLLKPLQTQEMTEKLQSIDHHLLQQREFKEQSAYLTQNLQHVQTLIAKEIIDAYLSGASPTQELRFQQQFLRHKAEAGYFMLLCLRDDSLLSSNNPVRIKVAKEKLKGVVQRSMVFFKPCLVGDFAANLLPIFVALDKGYHPGYAEKEAKLSAQEVLRSIERETGILCSIVFGKAYHGEENFRYSYQEAASVAMLAPVGKAVGADELEAPSLSYAYPYALENQLQTYLRLGDTSQFLAVVSDILSDIFSHETQIERICEHCTQLALFFKKSMHELGINPADYESFLSARALQGLLEPEELERYIRQAADMLALVVAKRGETKNFALIARIEKYIDENITKDISLATLADFLGLSPQYVSKLFKEEFGTGYVDFITAKRIEKAKLLLVNTSETVNAIAQIVGYNDQNYFCRIFKKNCDMTSIEYRKLGGQRK